MGHMSHVTISSTFCLELKGCQRQHMRRCKSENTEWNNHPIYTIMRIQQSDNRLIQLMVTTPLIQGARKHHLQWEAVILNGNAICTTPGFILKKREYRNPAYKYNFQTASITSELPPLIYLLLRLRPEWLLRVKCIDQMSGIFKVHVQFPPCVYMAMATPLDEVMQHSTELPRVKYVVDILLLQLFDYHPIWFSGLLAYNWHCITINKWSVQNIVIQHSAWKE